MSEEENKEIPQVASVESTYGKPRFTGIPRDDQLIEESSMEGITHGRKISEVIESDTRELEEAGVSWEDGIKTLKYLAVACSYQEEQHRIVMENIKKEHFGDKEYWSATPAEREAYTEDVRTAFKELAALPGFGKLIKAEETGARVQFDNPIKDSPNIGDGTSFDLVAEEAPERKIIFDDGENKFVTTVNFPTLRVAEANHLLEKGNRYELTGAELALLVKSFDLEEFEKTAGEWLEKKKENVAAGMTVVPGHRELMTFTDNTKVDLRIGRSGGIDLVLSVEPFSRSMVEQSNGELKSIVLSGTDYHYGKRIKYDGNKFLLDQTYEDDPTDKPIEEGSDLAYIADLMLDLHRHATSNPDGILNSHADKIYELREKVIKVTNPN